MHACGYGCSGLQSAGPAIDLSSPGNGAQVIVTITYYILLHCSLLLVSSSSSQHIGCIALSTCLRGQPHRLPQRRVLRQLRGRPNRARTNE